MQRQWDDDVPPAVPVSLLSAVKPPSTSNLSIETHAQVGLRELAANLCQSAKPESDDHGKTTSTCMATNVVGSQA